MTTNEKGQAERSVMTPAKKVGLATSTLITIGSIGAMGLFGFSWLLLLMAIGGLGVSVGSALLHYIGSGAYLDQQRPAPQKRIQSRLNSLKFKAENSFSDKIDEVLEILQQRKNFEKQFEQVLKRNFSETEMAYGRYWSLWTEVSLALEKEAELVAETCEASVVLKEAHQELLIKVGKGVEQMKGLMKKSTDLYLSFEQNQKSENREELFKQLEELSKRTEKYLNL